MALCGACSRTYVPYTKTIGGTGSLCSKCYLKGIRDDLDRSGYARDKLEARYSELINTPDALEQFKGVCGFAACVHEMLKTPVRARELFEAVFHDLEPDRYRSSFKLANGKLVEIPFAGIMGKLATVTTALNRRYWVDWLLCRGLTHALKEANGSLYKREEEFSESFGMGDWHGDGHFAIQTDSLSWVAREICGLKVLWVLKHDYESTVKVKRDSSARLTQATDSLDKTAKGADRALIDRGTRLAEEMVFLLDGSTVMFTAMHSGHIDGWTGTRPDAVFTRTASTGSYTRDDNPATLPFDHWVIIDKANLSKDKKALEVSLWTWHTRRTITYLTENMTNYLREAIFVKV